MITAKEAKLLYLEGLIPSEIINMIDNTIKLVANENISTLKISLSQLNNLAMNKLVTINTLHHIIDYLILLGYTVRTINNTIIDDKNVEVINVSW